MRRWSLFVLILFILSFGHVQVVEAESHYKTLRDQKQNVDKERTKLQRQEIEIETSLQETENKMTPLLQKLQRLEREKDKLQQEIDEQEEEYMQIADEIETLTTSIDYEIDLIEARDEVIQKRMIALQANPPKLQLLYTLLSAESLAESWGYYQSAKMLYDADRAIVERQQRAVDTLDFERSEKKQRLEEIEVVRQLLQKQRELIDEKTRSQRDILQRLEREKEQLTAEQKALARQYEQADERRRVIENEMKTFYQRQIQPAKPVKRSTTRNQGETSPEPSAEKRENVQVKCQSGVQLQTFHARLNRSGALKGSGDTILKLAKEYEIDPVLFAAITIHETGNGTSRAVRAYNNPGGLMNPKTNWSTLIRFSSLEEGLRSTAKTLHRLTHKGNLTTVEALGNVYAPIGAANDPTGLNRHWAPNVKKFMNELGGTTCK